MPGFSSIFVSLCRGRPPRPEDKLECAADSNRSPKALRTCLDDIESKGTHVQAKHTEAQKLLALLRLQRELGAIHGTWLSRARAIMATLALAFDAAEVRLYGAARADNDGPPSSFTLLLSTADPDGPAISDAQHPSLTLPGQVVLPEMGGEPDSTNRERLQHLACDRGGSIRRQLLDLLPRMLDELIASQAPVFQTATSRSRKVVFPSKFHDDPSSSKTDGKERLPGNNNLNSSNLFGSSTITSDPAITRTANSDDMAALIPLLSGNRLYGALWLACHEGVSPTTSARLSNDDSLLSSPSPGASIIPPASASSFPSPSCLRLQDSFVLQELSLSLSMCLLSSDLSYMVALCDCLHHISAATSMQAFLGAICNGIAQFAQLRIMLEPRVIPALVPESSSAVGLMVSYAADRPRVAAGLLPSSTSAKMSCLRPPSPQQSAQSAGVGGAQNEGNAASAGAPHTPLDVGGSAATVVGKEVALSMSLTMSETSIRNIRRYQSANAKLDNIAKGSAGLRLARTTSVQRVIPMANGDLLGTFEFASGSVAPGSAASTLMLRVKPFSMAHTLLQHLIRNRPSATLFTGVGAAAAHGANSSATPPPRTPQIIPRAYGTEVEDCITHVQSARHPSRDILILLANKRMGFSGSAPLSDRAAAATDGREGDSGAAGCYLAAAAPDAPVLPARSSSYKHALGSLLLLALPLGRAKGVLGMYVTFPQRLPVELLKEARRSLVDLLEVAAPLIKYKLESELYLELKTLSAAIPGSYAVVEGPKREAPIQDAAVTVGNPHLRSTTLGCIDSDSQLHSTAIPDDEPGERFNPTNGRTLPYASHDPHQLMTGQSSFTLAVGARGSGTIARMSSINLLETLEDGLAGIGSGMGCFQSGQYGSAVTQSNIHGLNTGRSVYSASMILVEEMDAVNNSMRVHMPLLVASMQNSISNLKVEATVTAMADAMNQRPVHNTALTDPITSLLPTSPEMGDLAHLELHDLLGQGGSAVVFKGCLGAWDCAVKVMEMPEVDDFALQGLSSDKACFTGGAGVACRDRGGNDGGDANDMDVGNQQAAARRTLLRNAMELAAMATISHPNIMQVYSTFSNVTLDRRIMPDKSETFFLQPAEDCMNDRGAAPVCVAIVCEWCDKGCLASALSQRTFPTTIAFSASNSSRNRKAATRAAGARMLDFRVIYMTLLDIAMALRHLHTQRLVHRDLKPANVLLKTNPMDPRGFTAKLADFGFVTLLNQQCDDVNNGEPFTVAEEPYGTVTHMAPECWNKPARLDATCDVYSFGIIMWELTAGGARPFPEVQPRDIPPLVQRGVRPIFHEAIPMQYRLLAQRCWSAEPSRRPRTSEIVNLINQQLGHM